jgi:hypothetical protein
VRAAGRLAAARPEDVRGAAVRRLADVDGAAGLRAVGAAVVERVDVGFAAVRPAVVPAFRPAAASLAGFEPFVPFAEEPFASLGAGPFAAGPGAFLAPARPFAGVVPLPPLAPDAPVRGVDEGRAPEPRAEPEGRAGRREEGMGRLCRFARPLYRHYLRRAVCRSRGARKLSDTGRRVRRTGHPGDLSV